jgi:ribonuclease Z
MAEVTFLGTGSAFTSPQRYWSGFLVNGRYLFDCPPTSLPHLKRLGIPPSQVRAVFITHFHGDHFMGFPFLVLEYCYLSPRRDDLYVVTPPGGGPFLEDFLDRCFPDLSRQDAGYRRIYLEANEQGPLVVDGLRVWAKAVQHATGKLRCFGYRMELPDLTLAYSGDAELSYDLVELSEGADVMVVDCTYAQQGPEHMGLADILQLRSSLHPRTLLVLSHVGEEFTSAGLANTMVARDLATYSFRRA